MENERTVYKLLACAVVASVVSASSVSYSSRVSVVPGVFEERRDEVRSKAGEPDAYSRPGRPYEIKLKRRFFPGRN